MDVIMGNFSLDLTYTNTETGTKHEEQGQRADGVRTLGVGLDGKLN